MKPRCVCGGDYDDHFGDHCEHCRKCGSYLNADESLVHVLLRLVNDRANGVTDLTCDSETYNDDGSGALSVSWRKRK